MILYEAAVERLGRDRIRTGRTLASFEQMDNGKVSAAFKNRKTNELLETVQGDILIAADGIHSLVRKSFYPDEGPPRFSGMMMWRGTTVRQPIKEARNMIIAGNLKIKFVACG